MIEGLFIVALLAAVVPGLRLVPGAQVGSAATAAVWIAALLLAIAMVVDPGVAAGVLSGPWLVVAVVLAVSRLPGLLSRRRSVAALGDGLAADAACAYLAVGATWALISRFGWRPMGFEDRIVLLTAVHFHVAGFVLHNDYSERAFQLERGGQWVKGKSCDTFAPLGPFLATRDEIPDVNRLRMWLKVNDEMKQDSSSSNMVFKVPKLVSYVSEFMSLLPGDVISTGTPAGVGLGQRPPVYLKEGDVVELGIDGLGSSRQRLRAHG